MTPIEMWLMIAGLGAQGVGMGLNANAQSNATQLGAAQFEEQRGDTQAQSISNFLNGMLQQQTQQGALGLQGTQMDPYAQAKFLNSGNIKRSYGMGLGPNGMFNGSFDMSALTPESMQKSADMFYSQLGNANPNVPVGPMSSVAGANQKNLINNQDALRNAVLQYLQRIGKSGAPGSADDPNAHRNTVPVGTFSGGTYTGPQTVNTYLARG